MRELSSVPLQAFAAVGTIEAAATTQSDELRRLSTQYLVDCTPPFAVESELPSGCKGGLPVRAHDIA